MLGKHEKSCLATSRRQKYTNGEVIVQIEQRLLRYLSRQNHPYFCFSLSAQLVRLCDSEDFYDPLSGWLPFLLHSISENKTKLKTIIQMDCVKSRLSCATWKTLCRYEDFYKLLAQIIT